MKKYLFIVLAAVISLFSSCAEDDAAIGLSDIEGFTVVRCAAG